MLLLLALLLTWPYLTLLASRPGALPRFPGVVVALSCNISLNTLNRNNKTARITNSICTSAHTRLTNRGRGSLSGSKLARAPKAMGLNRELLQFREHLVLLTERPQGKLP